MVLAFTRSEFVSQGKERVAVGGQLFAIKKMIEQFLFMALQKMKNLICPKKNLMLSRNYLKSC